MRIYLTLLTYFVIYSMMGWVLESIFRSIIEKKIINTGFLIGPFCPIYGVGACIMLLFLESLSNNIVLLFIVSFVVLTLWEYIVGIILEKMFHTKYWDYSNNKLNFQGRICLSNSIYWGILGIVFIKFLHPTVQMLIQKVDIKIVYSITLIIFAIALVDAIVTIVRVKNIRISLERVEELNNEIKEKLKEIKEKSRESGEETETKVVIENAQKIVDKLKQKRDNVILGLYRNVNRLKNAFPDINTKEFKEVLSRKVEINKIKELRRKKGKKKKDIKLLEK